jgi:hypothetical protein
VKGRVVTADNPSPELSAIRSWDFDALVIVLFDDDFRLWQAAKVPMDIVREDASWSDHVRGHRVIARDELMAAGEDWVERLRAVLD